jgi:hypothetical protein
VLNFISGVFGYRLNPYLYIKHVNQPYFDVSYKFTSRFGIALEEYWEQAYPLGDDLELLSPVKLGGLGF